jgi:membrane protease YdiL (CAAX protease family)
MTLTGIDKNWITDIMIGIAIGIAYLFLNLFTSFGVIGTPDISAISVGMIGQFIIIVLLAPIFEEALFRDISQEFFEKKLKFGLIIGAIISSILFSAFHYGAYEKNLASLGGSFLSAFIFACVMVLVRKKTNSIASTIMVHMTWNFYVLVFIQWQYFSFG